ncbi:MAG: hypothetical protein HOJ79_14435 [Nitrospina sp.]|nr:hypothetical protein [Nitrospina sp.]
MNAKIIIIELTAINTKLTIFIQGGSFLKSASDNPERIKMISALKFKGVLTAPMIWSVFSGNGKGIIIVFSKELVVARFIVAGVESLPHAKCGCRVLIPIKKSKHKYIDIGMP